MTRIGTTVKSESANRLTTRCPVQLLNHSSDHAIHHQS